MPPRWVMIPSDREILAGDQAVVNCKVDGAPKPKITWMKAVGNLRHSRLLICSCDCTLLERENKYFRS